MIPNEPKQLLRLPALDAAIRALRKRAQRAARRAAKGAARHVLAVLEDVVVARVGGCCDDVADVRHAVGEAAVAVALAVDAEGGGEGEEGEEGG